MDIKKHQSSIVAATGGLLIASAIIFSVANTGKPDTYKVNLQELRELQSQLAVTREELDKIKYDMLVKNTANKHNTGDFSENSHSADNSENNSPDFVDDVNEEPLEENSTVIVQDEYQGETGAEANWTRIGEDEITAAFHEINPEDSHLLTTVCESETCQVEIAHTDKQAELQFLASISSSELIFSYEGHFRNINNDDGSTKSVFYFSRDPQTAIQ